MSAARSMALAALLAAGMAAAQPQAGLPTEDPVAADAAPAAGENGDFIRESRVIFPEASASFSLFRSTPDPEVAAGVSLRYQSKGDADMAFDIYVFPFGLADEKAAMKIALEEMRESFVEAGRIGYYDDVDLGRAHSVDIPLSLDGGMPMHGQRMTFKMKKDGEPFVSQAVLAFRNAYLVKLRASSPKSERRKLERLVDDAIEQLLPKINILHIGACSGRVLRVKVETEKPVDEKLKADADDLMRLLENDANRGCVAAFDDAQMPAGTKYETLRFKPGSWKAGGGAQAPSR